MSATGKTGDPATVTPVEADSGSRANRVVLVVALAVLNVVLLVLTVVFIWRIGDKRGGTPSNVALVDQAQTQQVISQVSADATKIFSYNYANPAASMKTAQSVLVNPAQQQYLTLVRLLQQNASGQQLTLVVKIVQAAAVKVSGSTATVLVFLDQTSTRASDKASTTSAAQVLLSAVKQGSTWKINNITTFSGPPPPSSSGTSSGTPSGSPSSPAGSSASSSGG